MSTIREQEEKLFAEWIDHEQQWSGLDKEQLDNRFCWDGLHFTGKPERYDNGNNVWWTMKGDGKQEELWSKAFIKPIFLCKDHNGYDEAVDTRKETGYSGDHFYHQFYKKYLILLYALTNYNPSTNIFPSFEESSNIDNYWQGKNGFFHAPVVRINLKKLSGGSSCSDMELEEAIVNDKEFIDRQRKIYKGANVFVCCHGGQNWNPIWDLLKWKDDGYGWFPDLEQYDKENDSFWYSKKEKVVVLCTPHMSKICKPELFYRPIPVFMQFMANHVDFFD